MGAFTAMAEAQMACHAGQQQIAKALAMALGRWARSVAARFTRG